MVRTVISLDEDDKAWLDREAARRGTTMTALVRVAVGQLRARAELESPPLGALLERTAGSWALGDGLEYQRRARDEW